jgi:hypothetical protein
MATDKQIAANRRNSQRSTGPRTPEGKARSSRNHLIHGLTATGLLDGESPERLAAIQDDLRAQCRPQGILEEILVERMALAYFRLGRFGPVEAFLLQREAAEPTHEQLREKYGDEIPEWKKNARQYDRVTKSYLANQKSLHRLSLYEARLERSFDRALHDLQRLQAARPPEAEPAPNPASSAQPDQPASGTDDQFLSVSPEAETPAEPATNLDSAHPLNSPVSNPIRI